MIALTPEPPYYAVIFTSVRTEGDKGYNAMSEAMIEEVRKQPGFLGFETARNAIGITVSYWKDLESVRLWRENSKHRVAREKGKTTWYEAFRIRICRVEREYGWQSGE